MQETNLKKHYSMKVLKLFKKLSKDLSKETN